MSDDIRRATRQELMVTSIRLWADLAELRDLRVQPPGLDFRDREYELQRTLRLIEMRLERLERLGREQGG
jgi:hypothetical protein